MMTDLEQFRLPVCRSRPCGSRLWREWCFARVVARHFRIHFLLMVGLLLGGAVLFMTLEPDKHHTLPKAMYYTWVLIFGQPPEVFEQAWRQIAGLESRVTPWRNGPSEEV